MSGTKEEGAGRKARGEETRATLIEVGSRLFAKKGYDGVSMRTLAAAAGVNLATVSYHFGGKPGLYQAIIEQIITVRDEIFPRAEDVRARLEAAGDDIRAKGAVTDWFVGKLVHEMLGHSEYDWAAFLVSRELAQPSHCYHMLVENIFNPSFTALCVLVSGIVGDTTHEDTVLTAHCIIAVITHMLEAHIIINQRLGWKEFPEHLDRLDAIIRKRIRGLLGLPMEDA
ncbi:MAG: CerR family C-terminal domain-containing protein [Pseudodesulfovibrio sp.]